MRRAALCWLRRARRAVREWWDRPALTGLDTGQMRAIAAEISARPFRRFEPDPEWAAEALARSTRPRLYDPNPVYWRDAWREFSIWSARMTAERNTFRRECGLPPVELEPVPVRWAA